MHAKNIFKKGYKIPSKNKPTTSLFLTVKATDRHITLYQVF
jgi:hypothetical protein